MNDSQIPGLTPILTPYSIKVKTAANYLLILEYVNHSETKALHQY